MSLLLDGMENYFECAANQMKCKEVKGRKKSQEFCSQSWMKDVSRFKNAGSHYSIKTTNDQKGIVISSLLHRVYRQLSFILTIKVNMAQESATISYDIVGPNDTYFVIPSQRCRLLAIKFAFRANGLASRQSMNYRITAQGTVQMASTINYNVKSLLNHPAKFTQTVEYFERMLEKFLNSRQSRAYQVIYLLTKLSQPLPNSFLVNKLDESSRKEVKMIEKIISYLHIIPNLQAENGSDAIIQRKNRQESSTLRSRESNFIELDENIQSVANYLNVNQSFSRDNLKPYFSQEQKRNIILMQDSKKQDSKADTCWIVNHIFLKNDQPADIRHKIAEGGFSDVYKVILSHKMLDSHKVSNQPFLEGDGLYNKQQYSKSVFVLKRQRVANNPKPRVPHQIAILKELKSVPPKYFPKYYFVCNQNKNQKYYDLIQESIETYGENFTLKRFLQDFHATISLKTRLKFAFQLTQALKKIAEYQIVHLDFKPSNILVQTRKNFQRLKVIDFGESFHKNINVEASGDGYKPGITAPYSAPENYVPQKQFNYKSDVFSLGVILHLLFYQKAPFCFTYAKQGDMIFKNKQIHNRWLFTPEENEIQGEGINYMLIVIAKCLDPDPTKRPQLQWISLIIRLCYSII